MNSVISANSQAIKIEQMLARSEKQRSYPLPKTFETELLIKRVKDGGQSGDFLSQAFLSAYDKSNFQLSLGQLINIDAEGMRLFHQIVHLRHIQGWSDLAYNDLAARIKDMIKKAA